MKFFTIGVYNSTELEFFDKLVKNKIDTFCDIRQRRNVRGPKYPFANSTRLQARLKELGIKYEYIAGLAPTAEIRNIQKKIDAQNGESANERQQLGQAFKLQYVNKIINSFDFKSFFDRLQQAGAKNIVFFCVEESAEACHRSLVTKKLNEEYGYKIKHL
jgi:hypothetical protein